MAVKIFFCYAHEDGKLLSKLQKHLRPLQWDGLIDVWYDRDISAGSDWAGEIDSHLNTADIILLLISPDFMNSDYCYRTEMKRAIERHEKGEAHVIPVILRYVYWNVEPLRKLQALPIDGKPITDSSWSNQDKAFYQVTEGIRKIIVGLIQQNISSSVNQDNSEAQPQIPQSSSLQLPPLISTSSSALGHSSSWEDEFKQGLSVAVSRGDEKAQSPLTVSIMGQTGVGKTSLINALFNTALRVNPLGPGTTHIQSIQVKSSFGRGIWFYDLPGLGESQWTDEEYLKLYGQKLLESDVAIWAVQADSRSFLFDHRSLIKLLDVLDQPKQIDMMSKITFVLTKADLVSYDLQWIYYKTGDEGVFAPTESLEEFLKKKESYFREKYIIPFKHLIRGSTYFNGEFKVNAPFLNYQNIDHDKHMVYYNSFLEERDRDRLKALYPQYSEVFERLYDHYRIILCSSKFRYNLDLLARVIAEKLSSKASINSGDIFKIGTLNKVPLSVAKQYSNMIFIDEQGSEFNVDE